MVGVLTLVTVWKSVIRPALQPFTSAELAAVVDAWPKLPEAIKAGILAMVRAADESVIAHCPGKKLQ